MRIQIELTPDRVSKLKTLMAELQIDSYKDLFNNALSVLDWVVEETRNGQEIASVNEHEKKYRVLVLPALQSVAASLQSRANGSEPVAVNGTAAAVARKNSHR